MARPPSNASVRTNWTGRATVRERPDSPVEASRTGNDTTTVVHQTATEGTLVTGFPAPNESRPVTADALAVAVDCPLNRLNTTVTEWDTPANGSLLASLVAVVRRRA